MFLAKKNNNLNKNSKERIPFTIKRLLFSETENERKNKMKRKWRRRKEVERRRGEAIIELLVDEEKT